MRFNIRIKCSRPGCGNAEKNYTITAPSARDAKEYAKNKCKQEGLKFIGIVKCDEIG